MIISYDPNVRPQLQPDPADAREQVEAALRHAHVVKASTEDLEWLYGRQSVAAVAKRWLGAGPELVVVTRGGDGAVAFVAGAAPMTRPVHPAPAVDTVGAGDAFTSGLLDALARRDISAPARLIELQRPETLAAVMDDAALVAGLTCTRPGADPPRRAEVERERTRPVTEADGRPLAAASPPADPRPPRPAR